MTTARRYKGPPSFKAYVIVIEFVSTATPELDDFQQYDNAHNALAFAPSFNNVADKGFEQVSDQRALIALTVEEFQRLLGERAASQSKGKRRYPLPPRLSLVNRGNDSHSARDWLRLVPGRFLAR